MKKIITLTVLVLVAVAVFMVATAKPGSQLYTFKSYFTGSENYVAQIDTSLDQLRSDLATLEVDLVTGKVTESDASTIKAKLASHLTTINSSIAAADESALTPAMQAQLSEALDRLTVILTTYRDSLIIVDSMVENTNQSGGSTLIETARDTIEAMVDHVEAVTEEEVVLDQLVEETFYADENPEDQMNDANNMQSEPEPQDSDNMDENSSLDDSPESTTNSEPEETTGQ